MIAVGSIILVPSSSMISIVIVYSDELSGGLIIFSLPPIVSNPSARSSFVIGMLILTLV